MLSVVAYKWKPPFHDYRSKFGPETVNVLKRMVDRHYTDPHRMICVTDDAEGIDPSVEIVPLWDDYASIPSPHGGKNPSCYRRLRTFSPEIGDIFGPRFVSLDLDCVIVNDMRPVWNRAEDFVIWGDTNPQPGSHYNGGMVLMNAGARPQVWQEFDPVRSPKKSLQARCFGSDQGWISYCLGPGETKWSKLDGVYSYRNDLKAKGGRLPVDARIVMFHGAHDPWGPVPQQLDWVRSHWR
jgi:hypothetical protein